MSNPREPVVVVVGSLHYDIMVDAPDRPRKGETVTGSRWRPKFGGKGGNQAVAAVKAGAEVRMTGAVGNDEFGRFLLGQLEADGVDSSHIVRLDGVGSGMSVAITDSQGDYGAVIVSGANAAIDVTLLDHQQLWENSNVLILQNEVLEVVNLVAAQAAKRGGVLVCLNAAPYRQLPPALEELIDILVVNAIEAEQLCGTAVRDLASAAAAAAQLAVRFQTVVVTAGGDGVVGLERGQLPVVRAALPVKLISTHGAGDVFVGTLAAAIAARLPFADCIQQANAVAAAHVSRVSD